MHKTGRGQKGETMAALELEKEGMKIIARNIRSPAGEIDIVAIDGDILVFVEVKSWSSYSIEELEHAIDLKKQRRIIETAKYFLSSHREYNYMTLRFDVVFIGHKMGQTGEYTITHLESAFTEHI
ncbi:MAG: YraN family protein [Treponema sp.]|jgi:putative endonuclease|nr:YraN family protein [Treponema sp.]